IGDTDKRYLVGRTSMDQPLASGHRHLGQVHINGRKVNLGPAYELSRGRYQPLEIRVGGRHRVQALIIELERNKRRVVRLVGPHIKRQQYQVSPAERVDGGGAPTGGRPVEFDIAIEVPGDRLVVASGPIEGKR